MPDTFDLLLHGDVWDARGGRQPDRWVAVDDGEIASVTPECPGDASEMHETMLITPGLIDMHVHLVWDGSDDPVETLRAEDDRELTIRAVENARRQVVGGVTTVRDVGSTSDIALPIAQAVCDGRITGPRTVASGRTVIITCGHDPFWGIESDGSKMCRQAVRELRGAGAEVIKVSATGGVYGQAIGEDPGAAEFSREELDAIVDEADRFGIPVAAHAVGTEGIRNAVAAGVDTIEHGNLMNEKTLSQIVDNDIAYDPTLCVYSEIAESSDVPSYAKANAKRVVSRHREVFSSALSVGARILAGTDAGSPGMPHPSIHRELICLVEGGMDEPEALEAATLTAAEELGRPELGTLDAGTPADMVGFAADPLDNVGVTADPSVVITRGKRL